MTILRTIPMWLAILALTFNGFSRSGFVLCIGDEGHLAVEAACVESPAAVACCSTEHDEHEDVTISVDDHCGDCSDLLLRSHPPLTRESVMPDMPAPVLFSLPSMTEAARLEWGVSVVIPAFHDPSPPSGQHPGTIVLRL